MIKDQIIRLMRTLDEIEADMRRLEHRCYSVRNALGEAFKLKVGHYEVTAAASIADNLESRHTWKRIFRSRFDLVYECCKCQERHMISADRRGSEPPEFGCKNYKPVNPLDPLGD